MKTLIAVAAAVAAGGVAFSGGEDERPITGPALERAKAAALEHTGGGSVTETEAGDEEGYYEVEVTLGDGRQLDVHLDRGFRVLGDEGDEELEPSEFTTEIDNPYWPMEPGMRWVYRETGSEGGEQRVVVTVTHRTRRIANGVVARVVHDVVTEDGVPVEVTDDWYAQDSEGNVWYLGEDTTEYEDGRPVSHEGSFEAGVDGARAGIVMPADPRPGFAYRQELYRGHAEDRGEIVSLGEQAEVPAGHFTDVLMTKDVNPLEPKVLEFKFYARGVGPVLAVSVSGGSDREELVRYGRSR